MKTQDEIYKNERIDTDKVMYMPGAPAEYEMYCGTVCLPDARWCTVVWGRKEPPCWEHVSVSPIDHKKTPTWNDMATLKDIFWDDEEEVIQIHPKKSQYVNIQKNCLHLWKPIGVDSMLDKLGEIAKGKQNG